MINKNKICLCVSKEISASRTSEGDQGLMKHYRDKAKAQHRLAALCSI